MVQDGFLLTLGFWARFALSGLYLWGSTILWFAFDCVWLGLELTILVVLMLDLTGLVSWVVFLVLELVWTRIFVTLGSWAGLFCLRRLFWGFAIWGFGFVDFGFGVWISVGFFL